MPDPIPPDGTWARVIYNLWTGRNTKGTQYMPPGTGQTAQQRSHVYSTALPGSYPQGRWGTNIEGASTPPPLETIQQSNIHTPPFIPTGPQPAWMGGSTQTGVSWGGVGGATLYQQKPGTKMSQANQLAQLQYNARRLAGPNGDWQAIYNQLLQRYGLQDPTPPGTSSSGERLSAEQIKRNRVYAEQQQARFGSRGGQYNVWDPESGMYGYQGNQMPEQSGHRENVYNPEGKVIGTVGASGLWWENTKRQSGRNYRWMKEQAMADGTWPDLQKKLRKGRDRWKDGIGTGRDQYTKNKAKNPPGGTHNGGKTNNGGGGGGGGGQYYGNSLVQWGGW